MERERFIDALDLLARSSEVNLEEFQKLVLHFYRNHGRRFPWRETRDPYEILVSEIMLQQTQTDRVLPKYIAFLAAFPTWEALATASVKQVLEQWEGLGYYRRALNLQRAAKVVVEELHGAPPTAISELVSLPGIGPYTAAAVSVFAFGASVPMIETNIRSLYLFTFFRGKEDVSDKQVLSEIARSLYTEDPRAWFYALMDAGSILKKARPGINKRSKHYTTQTAYEGSSRQVRASVLKFLTKQPSSDLEMIKGGTNYEVKRIVVALDSLIKDGFVVHEPKGRYRLA